MGGAVSRRRHRRKAPFARTPPKDADAKRWWALTNGAPRDAEEPESSRGRRCAACGRVLDREEHEYVGQVSVEDRRGRIRKHRQWRCRVRLLAQQTAPILRNARDGAPIDTSERRVVHTFAPDSPQRTAENQTAFVPLAILQVRKNHG